MFCDPILNHFEYHFDVFAFSAAHFGKHKSVLLSICLCILIFDGPLIGAFFNDIEFISDQVIHKASLVCALFDLGETLVVC